VGLFFGISYCFSGGGLISGVKYFAASQRYTLAKPNLRVFVGTVGSWPSSLSAGHVALWDSLLNDFFQMGSPVTTMECKYQYPCLPYCATAPGGPSLELVYNALPPTAAHALRGSDRGRTTRAELPRPSPPSPSAAYHAADRRRPETTSSTPRPLPGLPVIQPARPPRGRVAPRQPRIRRWRTSAGRYCEG